LEKVNRVRQENPEQNPVLIIIEVRQKERLQNLAQATIVADEHIDNFTNRFVR
jgi:hypothetical protein